jgi:hypothetical protein
MEMTSLRALLVYLTSPNADLGPWAMVQSLAVVRRRRTAPTGGGLTHGRSASGGSVGRRSSSQHAGGRGHETAAPTRATARSVRRTPINRGWLKHGNPPGDPSTATPDQDIRRRGRTAAAPRAVDRRPL